MTSSPASTRWIRPYGLGAGLVAAALGLALITQLLRIENLGFPLFLMAVAATAWYAGPGPGALAITLSAVGFDYFFTEPRYSFYIESSNFPYIFAFVLFAVMISWFGATRRRIEQELRQARDDLRKLNADLERRGVELEASNKELEAFAYSTSHDLRAPLRHVVGYTELLQKSASSALDEKSRRYVAMVLESAKKMGDLIDDLLAFSRLEETPEGSTLKRYAQNVLTAASRGRGLVDQILAYSRSQRGKRVPVAISQVVAETLELVRGSLPADIRLEASAPESPLAVIGDETQLHQVVMNLCSNAIQAMNAGGTLRVAIEAEDVRAKRALSHGALGPGRYVRLTIADRGSGMDEGTLARIFEPFFTTKDIGQGSTFTIHLPLADAVFAAADVPSARFA